jgi:CHAD domain-containing protein
VFQPINFRPNVLEQRRFERMPYRFKTDEPIERGFRRIAREQLDAALEELAAPEVQPKGVHECRKALKRLRALVRLVAPAFGKDKARRRIKALGEIARLLSGRRDQSVMMETAAKLASEAAPDGALTLEPLKVHFAKVLGNSPPVLDPECASQVRLLLLREVEKFSRASIKKRGFSALVDGLEKSYRHARKALKIAYGEPSDETFHTLRKSVQWHWRQMSLLGRAWPDEFAVRVAAARELSQILGDDHDLAMLIKAAAEADDISYEDKEAIISICLRKQQTLRAAAEHRAARLFAETPKAFTNRLAVYWKFSRIIPMSEVAQLSPQGEIKGAASAGGDGAHIREAQSPSIKPRLAAKTATATPSQQRA